MLKAPGTKLSLVSKGYTDHEYLREGSLEPAPPAGVLYRDGPASTRLYGSDGRPLPVYRDPYAAYPDERYYRDSPSTRRRTTTYRESSRDSDRSETPRYGPYAGPHGDINRPLPPESAERRWFDKGIHPRRDDGVVQTPPRDRREQRGDVYRSSRYEGLHHRSPGRYDAVRDDGRGPPHRSSRDVGGPPPPLLHDRSSRRDALVETGFLPSRRRFVEEERVVCRARYSDVRDGRLPPEMTKRIGALKPNGAAEVTLRFYRGGGAPSAPTVSALVAPTP